MLLHKPCNHKTVMPHCPPVTSCGVHPIVLNWCCVNYSASAGGCARAKGGSGGGGGLLLFVLWLDHTRCCLQIRYKQCQCVCLLRFGT